MKKAYFSPVTSLLMSLSLAVGILVSDLSGYNFLTRAHAREGGNCGGQGATATLVSETVIIEDGLILNGITVRNITVNGTFLEHAVIAGSLQVLNATVTDSPSSIIYLEGDAIPTDNGVIVGSERPCASGATGVIIGSEHPSMGGVIIGSEDTKMSGVTGVATGTAVGGALTGNDIVINDGVITGQNLLLSDTSIDQGSISGTIKSIRITPAN